MGDVEYDYRSSAGDIKEFIESPIWADLKNDFECWLEAARNGLEDIEASEKELYRNQGRAEAVRRVLLHPEVLMDSLLEDQRDESSRESNKDELEEIL